MAVEVSGSIDPRRHFCVFVFFFFFFPTFGQRYWVGDVASTPGYNLYVPESTPGGCIFCVEIFHFLKNNLSKIGCHGNIEVDEHIKLFPDKFLKMSRNFIAFAQILKKLLRVQVADGRIPPPPPPSRFPSCGMP